MTVTGTRAASDGRGTAPLPRRAAGSAASRALAAADRHPVWTVVLAAVLARLAAVIALGPLRPGILVPDEQQYLDLAASVASGAGAEAWQPGYGQSLYDTTATFMRPLALLVRLFGEHQVLGQLLAAAFGVLTAVLTTWLALHVVRPRFAWLAGGLVALLPSQVFWSSVVLRESMVWAALAALALSLTLAARACSWPRLAAAGALAALALWAVSDLRGQTAVVALGALVLVSLFVRSEHRRVVPAGALLIAVVVPWGAGLGPAGLGFLEQAVPQLGVIRTNLSIGAESSFIDRTPLPVDAPPPSSGAPSASRPSDAPIVTAPGGEAYVVDDSAGASVSAAPRGLLAVLLRPLPWEPARNTGLLLAKVENLGWVALYVLALIGTAVGWQRREVLGFPVVVTGALVLGAAVTQANLGTAFRHRGQVLWALAVLAAVGAQYLVDRRRATSG